MKIKSTIFESYFGVWFKDAWLVTCAYFLIALILLSACNSTYRVPKKVNYHAIKNYEKYKGVSEGAKKDHARKQALTYFAIILIIGEAIVYDNRK